MTTLMEDLETYRVSNVPPSVFYIPEFITVDEEEYLIRQVYGAPKPKWTQLSNRRLQNWGGLPHEKGMVQEKIPEWLQKCCSKINDLGVFGEFSSNHILVNEYLPGQGIMPHTDGSLYYPTVSNLTLASHTLLDFYYPITGNFHTRCINEKNKPFPEAEMATEVETIEDKKAEASVATLEDRHFASFLLEPRSLVLVQDDMYKIYLHGIKENTTDDINSLVSNLPLCQLAKSGDTLTRSKRISLTIRHVPKVLKAKLFFGKR